MVRLILSLRRWGFRTPFRRAHRERNGDLALLFDTDWYRNQLERRGDALRGDALRHYVRTGSTKGLSPHPLFDPAWYLSQLPTPLPADQPALAHFLREGGSRGYSPHPLFDSQWYLDMNPDVEESGVIPLLHFLWSGASENRNPNRHFDVHWYRTCYLQDEKDTNPLIHYIQHGAAQDYNPNERFDTRWYRTQPAFLADSASGGALQPLTHFLTVGLRQGLPPNPSEAANAGGADKSGAARRSGGSITPTPARRLSKLPLTILVIAWDVGHNPLGRAHMLAEIIDRAVRKVILAGFQFPRYGDAIWEPLRTAILPTTAIEGENLPDLLDRIEHIASTVQPDIVVACKPRLPSLLLGLRIRDRIGCPLILDIDDHELSFFPDRSPLSLDALEAMPAGSHADEVEPYGEVWTRLAESLIPSADQLLVSNTALQRKYGGLLIPHARDETLFDPAVQPDRTQVRASLGIPESAKVVLFFGTLREHKGIHELARAIGEIEDDDFMLLVVGKAPDRYLIGQLQKRTRGRVLAIPSQPFDRVPEIMMAADIVALPQDITHPISLFQLPAKAIDALAMGVPLLVSRTPPLMDLVENGVATLIDENGLARQLARIVDEHRREQTSDTRARFLQHYSHEAAATALHALFSQLKVKDAGGTRDTGERVMRAIRRQLKGQPITALPAARGQDIIVFWKQNDTTLYGRRHDMVIKYLASRDDVRRVFVFDLPASAFDLNRQRADSGEMTEDRHLSLRTDEKLLGLRDEGKIRYRTFVYQPGLYRQPGDADGDAHPLADAFRDFVASVLAQEGAQPRDAIFWVYPKNRFIESLIDAFQPRRLVVDIVDDHRAWPNVTDEQRAELTSHYRNVLARADFAFANCQPVADAMREFFPAIQLIPNGCEVQPMIVAPPRSEAFEVLDAWPGKIIGYIGNLEAKIDLDLLRKISQRFPDCLLVLAGSTHSNPAVRALTRETNILMPGVVPYGEAAAWVDRFSVGIIPHLDMPLTHSMNPLKLFVYATHGVPVVATDIPNLSREWEGLSIAADHDAFLVQLKARLDAGTKLERRSAFVLANSWASRFEAVVDRILSNQGNRPNIPGVK